MAQRCDVCGKGTLTGNSVSHAKNATRRVWNPNLQHVRALVEGRVKNIYACTRCLKGNKVQKASRKRRAVGASPKTSPVSETARPQ